MADGLKTIERGIERVLFAARWLLAPFYLGLAVALAYLLFVFGMKLVEMLGHGAATTLEGAILDVLSLIDLSLAANLVIVIILAGYENFVSRMEEAQAHGDRPTWMGKVGFAGLKIKLYGSIVAISGIQLLKTFMETSARPGAVGPRPDTAELMWLTIIHVTFVVTTVLSAAADWLTERAKAQGAK